MRIVVQTRRSYFAQAAASAKDDLRKPSLRGGSLFEEPSRPCKKRRSSVPSLPVSRRTLDGPQRRAATPPATAESGGKDSSAVRQASPASGQTSPLRAPVPTRQEVRRRTLEEQAAATAVLESIIRRLIVEQQQQSGRACFGRRWRPLRLRKKKRPGSHPWEVKKEQWDEAICDALF